MNQHFTLRTAIYVVVASMIGAGILTTSGYIVTSVQSYGLLLLLWLLGGAVSIAGAFSLAEMATAYPKSGGDYHFVRAAAGDRLAFVYGWSMVLAGYAAPVALIAYTVANYLSAIVVLPAVHEYLSPRAVNLFLASGLIIFFTWSHCVSHQQSSWVQDFSTIFKLLVFAGIAMGVLLSEQSSWLNLTSGFFPEHRPRGLGAAMIMVMYAYTGWNAAVYLAGEMEDPKRSVPMALIIGCLLVTFIYLAINVFYACALPLEEIIAADEDQKGRIAAFAISRAFGEDSAKVFSILLSLGMLSSISAFTLTGPRILYAMASDGISVQAWGQLSTGSQLPTKATISQGAISLAMLWSGTFAELLDMTGFALALVSLVSVGVIFRLRRKPSYQPSMRCPWYPWLPLAFCTVNVAMLFDAAWDDSKNALISVLLLALAWPLYDLSRRKSKASLP